MAAALDRFLGGGAERIDTHTAAVLMAGDRALKLRRPVNYGWLDYSTRARRRAAARREIASNNLTAPGLCEGLAGLVPDGDGWRMVQENLPDDGEPVVVMHRFPQSDLLDRMASEGRLDRALIHALGHAVAEMHKAAQPVGKPPYLPAFTRGEAGALDDLAPVLGPLAGRVAALLREAGRRLGPVAADRPARRCHGDLHLRNIVLWQGRPAPFDAIDFNDDFTDIDPLYDLAFLLMDLDHRGHPELATTCLNAWAERLSAEPSPEPRIAYAGLALLPLYRACRAAIRAKVAGLTLDGRDDPKAAEARAYLELAAGYLEAPQRPRLIAVGGLSGSGKSTVARHLADRLGAIVLRSDAIRKGMWGIPETARLPREAYAPEVSPRVYAAMADRARMALDGGMPVILDAAHLREGERDAAAALAAEKAAPFQGLWLDADPETLAARVAARTADVSDADARVVALQTGYDLGEIRWTRIPAAGSSDEVAGRALDAISTA